VFNRLESTRAPTCRLAASRTEKGPLQSTKFRLQPRDSAPDYHSLGTCEPGWGRRWMDLLDKLRVSVAVETNSHNKLCLTQCALSISPVGCCLRTATNINNRGKFQPRVKLRRPGSSDPTSSP